MTRAARKFRAQLASSILTTLLGLVACATWPIEVTKPPTYGISLNPNRISLGQGAAGSIGIHIARSEGATRPVALAVGGLPSGVTVEFDQTSVSGSDASLVLIVPSTMPPGDYQLQVLGAFAGLKEQSVPLSLTVTAMDAHAVVDVQTGGLNTCAQTATNAVYCWGINYDGELGDGSRIHRSTPGLVKAELPIVRLFTGGVHSCGVTALNTYYCWGLNADGQLGTGDTVGRLTPDRALVGWDFVELALGDTHTCGLLSDGAMYCWGSNGNGQLGDGTTLSRPLPTPVHTTLRFKQISAGGDHTCGLALSGDLSCWGENHYGELGDGSTIERLEPVPVLTSVRFGSVRASIFRTCGLDYTSRAAYCWGSSEGSQALTPQFALGFHVYLEVAAGSTHACGLDVNHQILCWGNNNTGQLGNGTNTFSWEPTPIASSLPFASVSIGISVFQYTCGRTMANTVYCWGDNFFGQLGDGTTTPRSTPTLVQIP